MKIFDVGSSEGEERNTAFDSVSKPLAAGAHPHYKFH